MSRVVCPLFLVSRDPEGVHEGGAAEETNGFRTSALPAQSSLAVMGGAEPRAHESLHPFCPQAFLRRVCLGSSCQPLF